MRDQVVTFRFKPLLSHAQIYASEAHCCRQRETPNANAQHEHLNVVIGDPPAQAMLTKLEKFRQEGAQWRSDSVLAMEYVLGATPEYWTGSEAKFGQPDAWDAEKMQLFEARVQKWAEKEFGAENIASIVKHMDESSPHWHVFVIPLDRTPPRQRRPPKEPKEPPKRASKRPRKAWSVRLNAQRWIGGGPRLSYLQTRCAEDFADLGLKRGREGGRAQYQKVQQFYSIVNEVTPQLDQLRNVEEAQKVLNTLIEKVLGGNAKMRELAKFAINEELRRLEAKGIFNLESVQRGKLLKRAFEQLADDVAGEKETPGRITPGRSRGD